MKKLLKGALTLAIATIVGIPQMQADNDPNDDLSYKLQVKSYKFSKDNANGLKGVAYKNTYSSNPTWPMTEAYTKFEDYQDKYSFVANYQDFYNNRTTNNKTCYVKQFGVSMGVVYWIVPTKNVIYYWNTVTGEVGSFVPPAATYQGQTYSFEGATTGYGNITHDWYGNLVHQWNKIGVTSPGINTPAQGFAIYKAPTTYGERITTAPKLSDMTTCNVPYDKAQLKAGSTTQVQMPQVWNRMTAPNPNIPSSACQSLWNQSIGTPVAMDYMGASGDFWGGSDVWSYSAYFQGKASGYLFFSYNNLIFGQMIAEGGYANWYLNYIMKYHHHRTAINASLSTKVNAESLNATYGHSREFYFMETDPLEYFWSVPFTGAYESPGPSQSDDIIHEAICVLPHNWDNSLGYQMTDWMSAPEVDSIKGYRVLINSANLNQHAANTSYRTGSIELNYCEYTGHDYVLKTKEPVSRNYSNLTTFYAYNNTTNGSPLTGHSVNSWNELERVNNNVLALYTHVPGKGFSKYYITAVEEDNPVTYTSGSTAVEGVKVERRCYSEGTNTVPGSVDALISWNAQKYDRETLNNYEVWYRTYKRDGSGNLVTLCDDTWSLAGTSSIAYTERDADGKIIYYPDYADGDNVDGDYNPANAPKGTFTHKAIPYGGADTEDTSDDYDIVYEYMVIPIYSASNHRGTEAYGNTTITSSAPRIPVNGTLSQIKEGDKYSFNLKLDVATNSNLTVPFADNKVKASITKYVLVAEDEESATALSQATSVECLTSGMTVTTGKGITPVFASHNCSHYTANGYYAIVEGFSAVSASGTALPSLVWHNVNPEVEYKVKVYGVANRGYNFVETGDITAKMTIPELVWSTTPAGFYKLVGDYGSLTGNEDMPIGSFRRIDPATNALDENPSNPVTLNNANYYGTNGSTLKPLSVTDEVLGTLNNGVYENAGWRVAYGIYLYDENGDLFALAQLEDQLASAAYAACYSNVKDVICDAIGLKVDYEKQTGEDGRTRKVYTPTNKTYTAKVDVAYRRITDGLEVIKSTYADLVIGSTSLSGLDVTNKAGGTVLGALHQRSGSHFYYDNATTNGYYPYYYDAAMLLDWTEDNTLNRYMGYYGASKAVCYGHYETPDKNPDEWVQYHAGSVLSDTEISSFTNQSGMEVLKGGAIGYDGTTNSNWSALAIANDKIPLNIHYVHGSNTPLNSAEAIGAVKFDVTLTAEYPIVNLTNQKAGFRVSENPEEYALRLDASTMEVMTVPTPLTSMQVSSTSITTGVEGILTNAAGGVVLYPNPVGSTFTLQAPMAMGEVKIFTMEGQLVKVVKDINDTMVSINVDELPQGMYIVSTLGVAKMMIKK